MIWMDNIKDRNGPEVHLFSLCVYKSIFSVHFNIMNNLFTLLENFRNSFDTPSKEFNRETELVSRAPPSCDIPTASPNVTMKILMLTLMWGLWSVLPT